MTLAAACQKIAFPNCRLVDSVCLFYAPWVNVDKYMCFLWNHYLCLSFSTYKQKLLYYITLILLWETIESLSDEYVIENLL